MTAPSGVSENGSREGRSRDNRVARLRGEAVACRTVAPLMFRHFRRRQIATRYYRLAVCEDVAVSTIPAVPGAAGGVVDLGNDVFQIDTLMAGCEQITAGYLIRTERPCLVETGTAPSAPVVRDALASLGVGPGDLSTVVVTHIHLDHAGGTGDIARMFPGAQVVVHERGARHLADPSRLMASARMVWGDRLDALFGELAPTPAERITTVDRTGSVDLGGGRRLDSHYSPGHARHHVGLIDSVSGDLYVGDAAGIYIPETGDLRPATPPPDFDLDTALRSLRTFAALEPTRLLFSHYGPVGAVEETLRRAADEINVWVEETRRARGQGLGLDHAAAMVAERTRQRYAILRDDADPELAARYERVGGTAANVAGIADWLDKTQA
jgi:glyoxylase-like metal-dependent hydrolase (beta-lactamase superfamily II)